MSSESDAPTDVGIGGRLNWVFAGAIGGVLGALVFGALLWIVDPAIISEMIPEIYGFETGGVAGWTFHLINGIVLGIIFAFIITREPILGTLMADVDTPFIAAMGPTTRIVLAGLVYGLAVWVFLPGIIHLVLISLGLVPDPFPGSSVYTLIGHLLYGMLLGVLVSIMIDIESQAQESEAPFEEATEGPADP